MANWIQGQGFYLVQSSKDQKKTDLKLLEIRLQEAELKLGTRNG
ncbi:hypothetical protein [Psychrobacillus psychrodurans]|nr:hypothetical protein [Psychrobacillus psychrodurans]SFN13687.1 hypothetical protein SAMN05421832_11630 [Psychrobacillus psychrodurans]